MTVSRLKARTPAISVILAVLILVFSLGGCGRGEKLENISFETILGPEESRPVHAAGINICVGSMITPEEGYAYYKKLLDYIGEKLGMKVNFIEKKTYAEVNSLLKTGGIDAAFVCGGPYVRGRDEFGLELLAVPVVRGEAAYYSYIIVNKDSKIESFRDLKGRKFAFADPLSNTGYSVPVYMLRKLGETPQSFFNEYFYTYSHDNSIKAVALGIVDGAAVDSLIWEYMNTKGSEHARSTRIIRISEPYGMPPVVTRPDLETRLKEKIRAILLAMHEEKEGKGILNGMLIEKFVTADNSAYDTIREINASAGE